MNASSLWKWLLANGYQLENPRPRLKPSLEKVIQDEMVEEVGLGEKEPDVAPELGPDVRLALQGERQFLIYAVDGRPASGTWNVGVNDIAELKRETRPWVLVLFEADASRGHCFANTEVIRQSAGWKQFISDGQHYEISTPGGSPFQSYEELLPLLPMTGRTTR